MSMKLFLWEIMNSFTITIIVKIDFFLLVRCSAKREKVCQNNIKLENVFE